MIRRFLIWLLVLLVAGAVLLLGWHSVEQREAQRAAELVPSAPPIIQLSEHDLVRAQLAEVDIELPISGTLRATNSALVKARVGGTLKDLVLREGDPVQAGQEIARIEPEEYSARLQQAEHQVAAAKAQLGVVQRQYDNNRALVDQGFISQTALDNSAAELNAARANLRAIEANAVVARKAVRDTVLTAPIAGLVSKRLVQPGEQVGPGEPVLEIVDLGQLELEVALSPADSVAVRVEQQAQIAVEGINQPVAARVVRINPSTQAGSRSVLAYLAVASEPGLRQGLFAEGTLATGRERVITIPLSSLHVDKPRPYVLVVETGEAGSRIVERGIQAGQRVHREHESRVAIIDGLADGELVLRAVAGRLPDGTPVRLPEPEPIGPALASPAVPLQQG